MIHQKYITIQEYESSTEKDEHQYLFKQDGELKGNNFENESILEYDYIFINCTKIPEKIEFA